MLPETPGKNARSRAGRSHNKDWRVRQIRRTGHFLPRLDMGSFLVCHPLLASHPKTASPQIREGKNVVIKWATFNSLIVRPKSARNSSRRTKVALNLSAFSACAAGLIALGQRRSQKGPANLILPVEECSVAGQVPGEDGRSRFGLSLR
jgi:hypothetical protein